MKALIFVTVCLAMMGCASPKDGTNGAKGQEGDPGIGVPGIPGLNGQNGAAIKIMYNCSNVAAVNTQYQLVKFIDGSMFVSCVVQSNATQASSSKFYAANGTGKCDVTFDTQTPTSGYYSFEMLANATQVTQTYTDGGVTTAMPNLICVVTNMH